MAVITKKLVFSPVALRPWSGRYGRIQGDGSVFHIRCNDGKWAPMIQWNCDDEISNCWALDCEGAEHLTKAVNLAKRKLSRKNGGSFVINEFGQVIVPARDGSGETVYVGRISGRLLFDNPFTDDIIDLSDDFGLSPGDLWNKPYVGCAYNLSGTSNIYFFRREASGGQTEHPPIQDRTLIKTIRSIRRSGAVRFIVNPYGIVLCKSPPKNAWTPEEKWLPCYVGRIDPQKWFKEEE